MRRLLTRSRVLSVLWLLAFGMARVASAATYVAVENPANQSTKPQPFTISGWAVDFAATTNSGVDQVQVLAYPNPGSGEPGILVGMATYGSPRSDVAQLGVQFTNSGYQITVRGLAPKTYRFDVYARSSITHTWGSPVTVTVQVQANPFMYTYAPAPSSQAVHVVQPFNLEGWAVDLASASGTGVDAVYLVAYPTSGADPFLVNQATYGISIPDVGTAFGDPRFAPSGFQISVSGLAPGQYDLASYARSTVAGAFNQSHSVRVDIDTPVPAPVISPPTGTYATPQAVTITIPQDAGVHITRDGTTPTLTSETYSGGDITVSVNTSLRARAFRTGWVPSPTVAVEYTIVGAAPTILTAGGQYEQPITVQISVPPSAIVRITRDGSTPTSTSEQYGGPLDIAQNTQLRAVAFTAEMAPSVTASADYTFVAGMPTFSPVSGTYTGPIAVALTSPTPGASLYWTVDGSDPTTSSNAYVAPISIAAGLSTTLKARAFRVGWTASAIAAANYITELTGPVTIRADVTPPPNSAGWNNTNVTVTFTCTNVVSCPAPVDVATETSAQVVSGTASNSNHSASASVTIKVDRTPPTVALPSPLPTPANGSLPLTGSASDSGSGIDTASCNGAPGTVGSGTVSCAVSVRYGANAIVMQATDVAGNAASRGSYIEVAGVPSYLSISPARRTLTIGETALLQPTDDASWGPPSALTWSSSDSAVAAIDNGKVTALGVGTTTITAASGNLSAQATVQVLPAGPMPVGTIKWSVTPPADYGTADVVVVTGRDTTSFASIESRWDPNAGESGAMTDTSIRGLNGNGETSYTVSAGLALNERVLRAIGDHAGGTILIVQKYPTSAAESAYNQAHGGDPVSLVRVNASLNSPGWRYPLGPREITYVNSFAQAADGTLFGLRNRRNDPIPQQLFALDGATGLQRFQLSFPRSIQRYRSAACPQYDEDRWGGALLSVPRIDQNGSATLIVTTAEVTTSLTALPNENCRIVSIDVVSQLVTVSLYRVSASGVVQVITLDQYNSGTASLDLGEDGHGSTLPGDDGGVLATWGTCGYVENQPGCQLRGRYVGVTAGPMFNLSEPPSISAPGHIAYSQSGAINMVTGTPLWANPDPYAFPAAALEGGNVQYGSFMGNSAVYTPSGSVVSSNEPGFFGVDGAGNVWLSPLVIRGPEQVGSFFDGSFGAVVATTAYLDPQSAFPTPQGSPLKSNAPPFCVPTTWQTAPRDYRQPRNFRYVFSDAFTPAVTNPPYSAEEKALVAAAFEKWKFGGDRGYTGTFAPWVSTEPGSPNLFLGKGTMSRMDFAYNPGAPQLAGTRVFLPYASNPGDSVHPVGTYDQNPALDQTLARMARTGEQWGTDPLLPDNVFGLYTHKDFPTQTQAEKDYFSFVVMHESGHLIGLGHPMPGCAPSTSVMGRTFPGMPYPTEPTELDKKALRFLLFGIQ